MELHGGVHNIFQHSYKIYKFSEEPIYSLQLRIKFE